MVQEMATTIVNIGRGDGVETNLTSLYFLKRHLNAESPKEINYVTKIGRGDDTKAK